MKNYLIVVDMQNDFIDGSLGTKEAEAIVSKIAKKAADFEGELIFTQDEHDENYLNTKEGQKLSVPHCIKGSRGFEICDALKLMQPDRLFLKETFGSVELGEYLKEQSSHIEIGEVTLIGVCTDICVISNALIIKAFLPEVTVSVDASLCAGVTPLSHKRALEAMKMCQIEIINETEAN